MAGLLVVLASPLASRAQTNDSTIDLNDVIQGARQWARENLDTNVVAALPEVDPKVVQRFSGELQARLQGDTVVDLAALRDYARTLLPLLQSQPETRPYAAWLKAQMDYLEVAEEIRQTAPPPPPQVTNAPVPVIPLCYPELYRF